MTKTIKEEHYVYYRFLEALRQAGPTNMWGASPYLVKAFNLSRPEADEILLEWIFNYDELVSAGIIERK